jgi:hypothetical protein
MSNAAGVGKITCPNITVICSHAGVSFESLLLAINRIHKTQLTLRSHGVRYHARLNYWGYGAL